MDASPYSGGVLLPVRIVSLSKTPFTLYEPEMTEAVPHRSWFESY